MTVLDEILPAIIVAFLWGVTNPVLKKSTKGIDRVEADNWWTKIVNEVTFLISNWKFILTILINQLGSLVYLYALSSADLSIISPLTNAMTFVITTITAKILGEEFQIKLTALGVFLVMAGVGLCVFSKH